MPTPRPLLSHAAEPFWTGLSEGVIRMQHCLPCDRPIHYPRAFCPNCGARETEWREIDGMGTLLSFACTDVPPSPDFADLPPQILAIVELTGGIRLATTIVGADPEQLTVGDTVAPVFDSATFDDLCLLRFRPLD